MEERVIDRNRDATAVAKFPTISAVIPTLNEAKNLPQVLAQVPDEVTEILIVDGHSTDDSVAVAMSCSDKVRVIMQDGNGKGNAIACGLRAAMGEITVLLDADGSTDPGEIPRFISALMHGYDFAKGTRFVTGGGSADITRIRQFGNRALVAFVNVVWGVRYTDLCYGYNAFWTRHAPIVYADCSGFEVETLMNIRVAASDIKVIEVPSFEAPRVHGVSNLQARRDGIRVLRTIISEWIRPR